MKKKKSKIDFDWNRYCFDCKKKEKSTVLTHSEPVGVVVGWSVVSLVASVGQWKPICFLLLMKAAEGVHLVWMSASLSPVGTF